VTLELDLREADNQCVLNATLRECGESHVIIIHVHATDRPRVLLVPNRLFGVGNVDV
jgi:hypothetical protein